MKTLSIIIVTYNSERLIYDCLDSIFKYNDIGDQLEIIIVDNCSKNTDLMFETIKTRYEHAIVLVKSPVNGGYGHGNNQGIRICNAPLVAVMNPDVRLVAPIFKKSIKSFESNKNIGLMGVNFYQNSNNPLYFKPEFQTLFKLIFEKYLFKFNFYKIEEVFFSGSFMFFDKKTFEEIGLYDENIFMYHEEADVSHRMLAIGKDTDLNDGIEVLHLAHGRDVSPHLLKIGNISRKYYFEKYNADINKYYRNLLLSYKFKYAGAFIMNNKLKKEEFFAWINLCRNRGNI